MFRIAHGGCLQINSCPPHLTTGDHIRTANLSWCSPVKTLVPDSAVSGTKEPTGEA